MKTFWPPSPWRHPVWTMRAPSGQAVVSLHVREQAVELGEGHSVAKPPLSLLIMFVLYRIRQAEEDVASAAMVAGIA